MVRNLEWDFRLSQDEKVWQVINNELPSRQVPDSVSISSGGNAYAVVGKKLFHLYDKKTWERVELINEEPSIDIFKIRHTPDDNLWIATANGVCRLVDGKAQNFTSETGRPHFHFRTPHHG